MQSEDVCHSDPPPSSPDSAHSNLQQAQKMDSLATVAGGIAHDVNNPLNGIINYAELIRDELGVEEAALQQYADMIVQETHRAAQTIRTFFQYIRVDGEGDNLLTVRNLLDGAYALVSAVLRHDGIRFQMEVADDLPPLTCHEQAVRQALMNLLLNARQAVNDRFKQANGEKQIEMQACRVERAGLTHICIQVSDNGAGMIEEVCRQATEPFFTTRDGSSGRGLGLSVSRQIVQDHNGYLELQSTPGVGTTVHVLLPADD